jgi:hypothetical protein
MRRGRAVKAMRVFLFIVATAGTVFNGISIYALANARDWLNVCAYSFWLAICLFGMAFATLRRET